MACPRLVQCAVDTVAAFNPAGYADIPLYNIQAVAEATGVPSITLRSWERRYGIPQPKRDGKGYRLYSERDIAIAQWLRERVQQGVGISRAVNMLRVLEGRQLTPEVTEGFDFDTLRERLMESIRRLDEAEVARIIGEALTVASVEDVALGLLQPTLYEIGEQWASGGLSVTTEHVGSNLLRSHLAQLIRVSPAPLRAEKVIIGCAPGELHDIGALMIALFLRRRGFDVIYLGASVEPNSLIADVQNLRPAALLMSASRPQAVINLIDLYSKLSAYPGFLVFGGRIFNEERTLASRVPGTFMGPDAAAAVTALENALSSA